MVVHSQVFDFHSQVLDCHFQVVSVAGKEVLHISVTKNMKIILKTNEITPCEGRLLQRTKCRRNIIER